MKLDGNNNKNKLYIIIIVGLLFLFVVGISFAYFQTQYGNGGKVDLKAKTYSVDELSFNIGEDITINPNQFNFAQGKGNLEGTTTASAILKANNKTHLAKMNYYAYVVVTKNEFKYTTSDKKAELVLSVEGPNGVVTTLPDLGNAIDVTDNEGNTFKGFDITEFSGVITLADNKTIEVTSSDNGKKEEDWKIKVTFINLDADQSNNSDKNFNANMMIQKEEADLSYHNNCSDNSIACHIAKLYTGVQGENNIYYHDSNLENGAGDNSYRYAGASADVKNYICLGSSESTCPEDNLYRIIGVFGDNNHGLTGQQLVKVIKNTSYGSYQWNSAQVNDWASASLNTTLNSTFKTEKLSGFEDKIAKVTWYLGGYSSASATAESFYGYERGTTVYSGRPTSTTGYIGLIYPSDYGYATTPDYWTTNLNNYDTAAYKKDWLYLGSEEWLLSPDSSGPADAWIANYGVFSSRSLNGGVLRSFAVRPSFYLLSSVNYVSGDGTSSLPFRVN